MHLFTNRFIKQNLLLKGLIHLSLYLDLPIQIVCLEGMISFYLLATNMRDYAILIT